MYSALSTLSTDQKIFADKNARLVVHESSNVELTTSDDELSGNENIREQDDFLTAAKRMLKSPNLVD